MFRALNQCIVYILLVEGMNDLGSSYVGSRGSVDLLFGWVGSVFHQPQPVSGNGISILRWRSLDVCLGGWVVLIVCGQWGCLPNVFA